MQMPKLYDRDSKGNIKVWQISTDGADIITTHGKLGCKEITTVKTILTGKNIGRANETTPAEQAEAEARSTYQKKCDKGYITELESAESKPKEILPMLAHKFSERGHNISFPCYVQPKLNGVRVLARMLEYGEIHYISRGGKRYTTLGRITEHLQKVMRVGDIFDGEVYNHDWSLQRIVSAVKKTNEDTENLEYHLYDMVSEDNFINRIKHLQSLDIEENSPLKLTPTSVISRIGEVTAAHNVCVQNGYEGLMLRNFLGAYDLKHRSVNLQKLKEFEDNEYKIVGGKEGTGSDLGCIVFECVTKEGNPFSVRPKGTVAYRQELFRQLPSLIGKELTVRHQGFTDFDDEGGGGLPVFPVGIVVRDYE